MEPSPSYSGDSASINPPVNPTFGGVISQLAETYERIVQARLSALNPPKNPPPGSFSYSPQNDSKARVANPAPSTLPASGLLSGGTFMLIGGGFLLILIAWMLSRR